MHIARSLTNDITRNIFIEQVSVYFRIFLYKELTSGMGVAYVEKLPTKLINEFKVTCKM